MKNIIIIIFSIILLFVLLKMHKIYYEKLEVNMLTDNSFYNLGIVANTDKIYMHGYHRFYEKSINIFKNMENIGILEIGVQTQETINLWLSYFNYAHVYGIDIDEKENNDSRVTLFKGDQSKLSDLQDIALKLNPMHPIVFIIDDGSHIPEHQILTFDFLFSDVLQNGGIYIIEDIELSYWKNGDLYGNNVNYGWKNNKSLIELFKWLIDVINKKYINDTDKNELNMNTNVISDKTKNLISSITFGQNCIIINKKNDYELDMQNEYNNLDYRYKNNI